MMSRAPLILNLVIRAQGSHGGGWRRTAFEPRDVLTLDYYRRILQTAERGFFDLAFLTDTLALSSDPNEALQWPLDPVVLMSALIGATSHIGLIATHSTTFNSPYNTARFFASIDHLSGGRAGWNVVTSSQDTAARNFGLDAIPEHDGRYARAAEYLETTLALWRGWAPEAVVGDKARGVLVDPSLIHPAAISAGAYPVAGALNTPRSPQVVPLISQAGASSPGRDLAARYADLVYAWHSGIPEAKAYVEDLRARARAIGRDPTELKLLPGIVPYIRSSEAEARRMTEELFELDAPERQVERAAELLGIPLRFERLDQPVDWQAIINARVAWGNPGKVERLLATRGTEAAPNSLRDLVMRLDLRFQHRALVGTPEQAADYIEEGFRQRAFDGVSVIPPVLPEETETFVDLVVPVLQKRGIHKTAYGEGPLRQRLGLADRGG